MISFDQVQFQSMTFASSMMQIWKHEYFGGLNTIIFMGIYFVVLCYLHQWREFVRTFIIFVFSKFKFILYWYTLSI